MKFLRFVCHKLNPLDAALNSHGDTEGKTQGGGGEWRNDERALSFHRFPASCHEIPRRDCGSTNSFKICTML
jgi:hypothetical protein